MHWHLYLSNCLNAFEIDGRTSHVHMFIVHYKLAVKYAVKHLFTCKLMFVKHMSLTWLFMYSMPTGCYYWNWFVVIQIYTFVLPNFKIPWGACLWIILQAIFGGLSTQYTVYQFAFSMFTLWTANILPLMSHSILMFVHVGTICIWVEYTTMWGTLGHHSSVSLTRVLMLY